MLIYIKGGIYMLKERQVVNLSSESTEPQTMTVDEILQEYEIKGLSLEDLQEKYVNMVDYYEDKQSDLKDENEELKNNINELQETMTEKINELEYYIENSNLYQDNSNYNSDNGILIFIIFVVAIIISYFVGKSKKA
jgi:cysteinyl-tRNA synthetase